MEHIVTVNIPLKEYEHLTKHFDESVKKECREIERQYEFIQTN